MMKKFSIYSDENGRIDIPTSLVPNNEGIERTTFLIGNEQSFTCLLDEGIQNGELFVNFWGYIKYRDTFFDGKGHWIYRFWYKWSVENPYSDDSGRWITSGRVSDNSEQKEEQEN